jgi:hypothetical protein
MLHPTRNLVKFHLMALLPSRPGASLDSHWVQRMGSETVDIDRTSSNVTPWLAWRSWQFRCRAWVLCAELIARKPQHRQTLPPWVLTVLQAASFRRETARSWR